MTSLLVFSSHTHFIWFSTIISCLTTTNYTNWMHTWKWNNDDDDCDNNVGDGGGTDNDNIVFLVLANFSAYFISMSFILLFFDFLFFFFDLNTHTRKYTRTQTISLKVFAICMYTMCMQYGAWIETIWGNTNKWNFYINELLNNRGMKKKTKLSSSHICRRLALLMITFSMRTTRRRSTNQNKLWIGTTNNNSE